MTGLAVFKGVFLVAVLYHRAWCLAELVKEAISSW